MARMMPGYCPGDVPPGEEALYVALSSSSETDGWIVLHSLGIADHVKQTEGEADFVVIVPDTGILVIEVKSHLSIQRLPDGRWKLGSQRPTARGPFQQAREAKYSLRRYLEKRGVNLRSVPMLHAVWFTAVRARTTLPADPDWHGWQVLDVDDLSSAPAAIRRTLLAGTRHLDNKIQHFSYGGVGPAAETAQSIASLLRPRFELANPKLARESQLASFLDEQFLALDAAADNRAVLFSGPAGSGKTFLAMEAARRGVAVGGRGRLLCFNRFLGQRLAADMRDIDGLTVGTLHREMLRLAGLATVPPAAGESFWKMELPDRALEALAAGDDSLVSEFLVIDEVQDVAWDPYLDVLDLMVAGGLKGGRLLFFGDFERQAIFENNGGRERLMSRAPQLTSYRLLNNCRNLPRIGYQVNMVSALEPGYTRFRRPDDGVDPTFVKCRAGEDQTPQLVRAVQELKQDGFKLNEIVVLSPLGDQSTAAKTADPWLTGILSPVNGLPAHPGRLQFATIQSFKGLEAPAVVVTDLDCSVLNCAEPEEFRHLQALLYIALTRATDRVFALIEPRTFQRAIGGG